MRKRRENCIKNFLCNLLYLFCPFLLIIYFLRFFFASLFSILLAERLVSECVFATLKKLAMKEKVTYGIFHSDILFYFSTLEKKATISVKFVLCIFPLHNRIYHLVAAFYLVLLLTLALHYFFPSHFFQFFIHFLWFLTSGVLLFQESPVFLSMPFIICRTIGLDWNIFQGSLNYIRNKKHVAKISIHFLL